MIHTINQECNGLYLRTSWTRALKHGDNNARMQQVSLDSSQLRTQCPSIQQIWRKQTQWSKRSMVKDRTGHNCCCKCIPQHLSFEYSLKMREERQQPSQNWKQRETDSKRPLARWERYLLDWSWLWWVVWAVWTPWSGMPQRSIWVMSVCNCAQRAIDTWSTRSPCCWMLLSMFPRSSSFMRDISWQCSFCCFCAWLFGWLFGSRFCLIQVWCIFNFSWNCWVTWLTISNFSPD